MSQVFVRAHNVLHPTFIGLQATLPYYKDLNVDSSPRILELNDNADDRMDIDTASGTSISQPSIDRSRSHLSTSSPIKRRKLDTKSICEHCGKWYLTRALPRHRREKHPDGGSVIACHECRCGKSFKRKELLTRHQLEIHGGKGEPVKCEKCGNFVHPRSLEKHQDSQKCKKRAAATNLVVTPLVPGPDTLTLVIHFGLLWAHDPLVMTSNVLGAVLYCALAMERRNRPMGPPVHTLGRLREPRKLEPRLDRDSKAGILELRDVALFLTRKMIESGLAEDQRLSRISFLPNADIDTGHPVISIDSEFNSSIIPRLLRTERTNTGLLLNVILLLFILRTCDHILFGHDSEATGIHDRWLSRYLIDIVDIWYMQKLFNGLVKWHGKTDLASSFIQGFLGFLRDRTAKTTGPRITHDTKGEDWWPFRQKMWAWNRLEEARSFEMNDKFPTDYAHYICKSSSTVLKHFSWNTDPKAACWPYDGSRDVEYQPTDRRYQKKRIYARNVPQCLRL